jgi:thioredoxin-dependent peroxiredoxin
VRDAGSRLKELNVAAIGMSPDGPSAQKKFDEKNSLGFPLLSDKEHTVAAKYGVWAEKTMYGKKVWGIVRSSFLINEGGKIIEAWYKISPDDTVPKALESLR